MIVFKKNLNRFYDTKKGVITSKKKAFQWMMKNNKIPVAVNDKKPKQHVKHHAKKHSVKHVAKKSSKYARPSYKKMYKKAIKQLQKLENQYSADKFHPFIANQTKHGYVSPKTNVKDVQEWMKHHTGKLFVVAALGTDNHYDVEACGSVDDLTVAGFAARDLVPDLIEKFNDGYEE